MPAKDEVLQEPTRNVERQHGWKPVRRWLWVFVLGLVLGFLLGTQKKSQQSVKVGFPGGSFELQATNKEIRHEEFLDGLFKETFSREGTLGWLRVRHGVYPIKDVALAEALQRELCDPIPSEPQEERLAKGRECANKPVVAALRRLAKDRFPPFHYVGRQVLAGVQADDPHRPGRGRVNVCSPGEFVGLRLEVVSPRTWQKVEVDAGGVYTCTGVSRYPEIQLDPADAARLFSAPTSKYETVIVVPL